MLHFFARRSNDVSYFTEDPAKELEGLRVGAAGWWLRGVGDLTDSDEVARVFTTSDRAKVVGYDLVISAPRPISILLALDPDHGREIVEAHRTSVAASIDYLEDRALLVREQRERERFDVPATWSRIASYTHGINRHGEPHLHDHVLVGAHPQGSSRVLDSRSLTAHAGAADALYRSSLRHELGLRTPWTGWRSFRGVEHVADLDEGYRSLWGGHHDDRGEKLHLSRADAVATWRADLERFEAQGVVPVTSARGTFDEHSFASAFEGELNVTRRHVVAAWANAAVYGQAPSQTLRSIDQLYPELASSRGVRELSIGVATARKLSAVRELGSRPMQEREMDRWSQRSRDRSRSVNGLAR